MSHIRVLIVDDAKFIRDHVSRIVRNSFPEYHIDAAEDGEAGRRLMSKQNYDLILCDWEMPGLTGLQLLQWARQQSHYRDIPFVMVTSRGERDYVLQAIKAGVNDYLGKPFEDKQLIAKVGKFVGKRLETSADSRRRAAQMLAAGQTAALQKKSLNRPQDLAQLRIGAGLLKCAIKDITLQNVQVLIKRTSGTPQILEPAVVDIESATGVSIAQLNGFVSALAANAREMESAFIKVDVEFVDNDPEKLHVLTKYITSRARQAKKIA